MVQVGESAGTKTFEEAVSIVGFGKYNLYIVLAAGSALMCVIVETMNSMFITPAAQCDLNLSLMEKGLLYSISYLGVVSSSHLWGYLADTKGRRRVILVSLISSAFVSFIGSFVSTTWLFIFLRYINGALVGGSSAVPYAFAGEFHDNKYRPKIVSWIAAFVAIANIYLPGVAWLILPQQWSFKIDFLNLVFRPWRLLMILYAVPSLISAILIYILPESPKYLLTLGKHESVLGILTNMFRCNKGKDVSEYKVSDISLDEASVSVDHKKNENVWTSMWVQTIPLFRRRYLIKTFMCCFLHFSIYFTTSSVAMWYPQIINSMSKYSKIVPENEVTICESMLYSENEIKKSESVVMSMNIGKHSQTTNCQDNIDKEVFLTTLIVSCICVGCYLFIGSVINVFGARKLLTGFIMLTTIGGICAQSVSNYLLIQMGSGTFLIARSCIGIINAIVVEFYPTQIRGMALSVSLMLGRLGAMAGSNVGGPLLFKACDYMFYIHAAIHILMIVVVLLLPNIDHSLTIKHSK